MNTTTLAPRAPRPQDRPLIKVLLVEDSIPDSRYVQELLPADTFQLNHVTCLKEVYNFTRLDEIEIILLDLSLPDANGLETILAMRTFLPSIPIVVLTGLNDESLAVQAIQLGAQDYILKHKWEDNILVRVIGHSIERHQTERSIRENAVSAVEAAAYLRLALSASHTGVWSWELSTDGVILDEQALSIFGFDTNSRIKTLQDFLCCVHPEDVHIVKNALAAAIENKEDYVVDFRVIWKENVVQHIFACGRAFYDNNGNAISMAGVCRNVTRQKLEQENAKKLLVLEKYEDFVATLSHDLKNPIIGAERLLKLILNGAVGPLDEKVSKLLDVLMRSNSDMLALIQNLLDVYRNDAQIQPLKLVKFDVSNLANACIEQLNAFEEATHLRLASRFPEGNHMIVADEIAVRRIIMNLLSNSMKFTESGGEVVISGKYVENTYFLEVQDTGGGMSQIDLDSLFQKYSQGRLGKKFPVGSGLGLYLCRQLIEAHHGEIVCNSLEGVMTIFTVSFPCAKETAE
jgi:signal transduction histidine kinase/DNA-binding response OmpR family regulator